MRQKVATTHRDYGDISHVARKNTSTLPDHPFNHFLLLTINHADMKTYPIAILIAALLGVHGLRKGSLSRSGAIGAFIAGYGHFANPLKVFGVTLIAFYLLGSRATKVGS